MLARVVRVLREAVDTIVVVGGVGQQLPPLAEAVTQVHDRQPDRGPLEGLAVGLHALDDRAEAAFVTGCDVPLLKPEFVGRMFELSAGCDVAVPCIDGRDHPLSAVYRISVLPQVESLLASGRLRPAYLLDQVRTRRVAAAELSDVDPELASLANVNNPAEYRAALKFAGIEQQGDR
jgi:molybdopterin-guanine dinucleotide biosynthesis protein A